MPLYGSAKYSEEKYGPTVLEKPAYAVEIDWNRDHLFDGTNEATYGLVSLTLSRGRKYLISPSGENFESDQTGRITVVLANPGGRYDGWNKTSPLYPLVAPGSEIRVRMRKLNNQICTLAYGIIDNIVPMQQDGNAVVRIECSDLWKYLRSPRSVVSIAIQEDVMANTCIGLILDAVNWRWGRNLGLGVDERLFWWIQDQSAAAAIYDLVNAEMGKAWISADGTINFANRYASQSQIAVLTDDDVEHISLEVGQPWESIRNEIRVKVRPLQPAAAVELWKLGSALTLSAGESATLWISYSVNGRDVPARNCITPVSTTDYLMNENQNGTGANLTSFLQVTASFFSTQAKLILTNTGSAIGYVTLLKVRGDAIVEQNPVEFVTDDAASQALYDTQTFKANSPWVQNVNIGKQFADVVLAALKDGKQYPRFTLSPANEYIYDIDAGQCYGLVLTSRGIQGDYRVIWVEKSVDANNGNFKTVISLEPVVSGGSTGQLPMQLPFQI